MDLSSFVKKTFGTPRLFMAALVALTFASASAQCEETEKALASSSESIEKRSAPHYLRKGADPWVVEYNGRYYWSQSSDGAREIGLWVSDSLDEPGEYRTIWRAPDSGMTSSEVWAPELHFVDGRFYAFFAASDGNNANHRTYVLKSASDDPFSNYELFGPLYTGDASDLQSDDRWAIDSTLFEHKGERYLIWSGWETDADVQYLYIAPLASDLTRTTAPRVKICDNAEFLWERVEERLDSRGLNEGPEILRSPNGRIFLTYSCGHSLLPTYKLGILEFVGDDPLDPNSWKKSPEPFFQSDEFQFGVGHASFIRDRDGRTRCYYHAKRERRPNWKRDVFWRYVDFDEEGTPSISYR